MILRFLFSKWVYQVTMWEKRVMLIVNSSHHHFLPLQCYLSGLPNIKDSFFSFNMKMVYNFNLISYYYRVKAQIV